jgi:hypothetical protein
MVVVLTVFYSAAADAVIATVCLDNSCCWFAYNKINEGDGDYCYFGPCSNWNRDVVVVVVAETGVVSMTSVDFVIGAKTLAFASAVAVTT